MIMDKGRRKVSTRLLVKFTIGLVLIGLVGMPVCTQEETSLSKPEPLRLTIKADKDIYGSDEPIHIDIKITNTRRTDLGPGRNHLTAKDDSLYIFIPKKIHVSLIVKSNDHFELCAGSCALDDNTMEKVLTGKLEPLEKEDFVSIPPGYFYGRRFDIPAKAKIRRQLTCSYSNKCYLGKKAGIAAWMGTIKSNVLDIRVEDNEETSQNEGLE